MDIINKHYEKLILVVCLVLLVLGLQKVGNLVREANEDYEKDVRHNARSINESSGKMVPDFDPASFVSKEGWIQRVKVNKPQPVREISEIVSQTMSKDGKAKDGKESGEAMIKAWDRRYFNILTRHSRKPIEEAEAAYRMERNERELQMLKEQVKGSEDAIKKREAEVGGRQDDTKLAELKMQLDGYQALLANTEMNILELKKRLKYISMFCTPQGSLVDPQELVCCPNPDCGSLMLSQEDVCPFCGFKMPEVNPADDEGKDSDQDGLPDSFEKAHIQKRGFLDMGMQERMAQGGGRSQGETRISQDGGSAQRMLNPLDASDAAQDFDDDSFTNLEEYRFGTDLDDPEDYPNPVHYVRLIGFMQDKFPVRLMGINEGRAPVERKEQRWRAQFSFMTNYRYVSEAKRSGVREYWVNNEDNWEQVRMGKRFEAPDGKRYVVDDLGYEEVNGKKRAYVKITEFIPPKRNRRMGRRGADAPPAEEKAQEPQKYTLYEREDAFYKEWYADLLFLANRAYGNLPAVYNNAYRLTSGAKTYRITTRFRLKEGETLTLQVAQAKRKPDKAPKVEKKSRLDFQNQKFNALGRQTQDSGRSESWSSSPEITLKAFDYKIAKFDRQKKTLEISWEEGKGSKSMKVSPFKENETYVLPDKRSYPLFYQGGNAREMTTDFE